MQQWALVRSSLSLFVLLLGLTSSAYAQVPAYARNVPGSIEQVIPMPGPLPDEFASLEAYQQHLSWRVSVLTERERQLQALARAPGLRRRIVLGFLLGSAATVTAYGSAIWLASTYGEGDQTARERGLSMAALGFGVLGMVTGYSVAIATIVRRRYRDERKEVRRERNETERRLQDANNQRARLTMRVSANNVGLTLKF